MKHLAAFLLMTCAAWCAPASTRAQASGADDAHTRATARALFHEGVACADRHDWACAAERFGRARAVRPSPVIVSNHAVALERLGRLVEASEAFRAVDRDPQASEELRATAHHAIVEMEPRIGRITVRVVGSAVDTTLQLDGAPLEASLVGVSMPVDPGTHVVEARRDALVVATVRVRVDPGETTTADVLLPERPVQPVTSETPPRPAAVAVALPDEAPHDDAPPAPHHEVTEEWWFWTLIGVVVVGGAATGTAIALDNASQGGLPAGTLGTVDVRP